MTLQEFCIRIYQIRPIWTIPPTITLIGREKTIGKLIISFPNDPIAGFNDEIDYVCGIYIYNKKELQSIIKQIVPNYPQIIHEYRIANYG